LPKKKEILLGSDIDCNFLYESPLSPAETEFLQAQNQLAAKGSNKSINGAHNADNTKRIRVDSLSLQTFTAVQAGISKQAWSELFPKLIAENSQRVLPSLAVTFSRQPYLISGHYLKLNRDLSHTLWTDKNDERLFESSVEEEITRLILPKFGASGFKFHSSGREDADVRMLGTGRIFFIEILQAKHLLAKDSSIWLSLQQEINENSQLIQVHSLQADTRAAFNQMKQNIENKRKSYRCVVYSSRTISQRELAETLENLGTVQLAQNTPIRVLHRRAQLIRTKYVYWMKTEWINDHWFLLDLCTSSGTYVKEFVHGDKGRTKPNISTLLNTAADIIQLDVTGLYDEEKSATTNNNNNNKADSKSDDD
jgi:tRNA U54 and U55 pseudouridine synthase Pus10